MVPARRRRDHAVQGRKDGDPVVGLQRGRSESQSTTGCGPSHDRRGIYGVNRIQYAPDSAAPGFRGGRLPGAAHRISGPAEAGASNPAAQSLWLVFDRSGWMTWPLGCSSEVGDVEADELAAATGCDEPDQNERLVREPGKARLRRAALGLPGLGGGAGVEDVPQLGRHQRPGLLGRLVWVRRMSS